MGGKVHDPVGGQRAVGIERFHGTFGRLASQENVFRRSRKASRNVTYFIRGFGQRLLALELGSIGDAAAQLLGRFTIRAGGDCNSRLGTGLSTATLLEGSPLVDAVRSDQQRVCKAEI